MEEVKRVTRSFTLILVITIVLGIPYVMAKIGQVVGLWNFLDSTYKVTVLFWFLFLVSRLAYAWAWVKLGEFLVENGTQAGFFWFKPDKYPHYHSDDDGPNLDYSGRILGYTAGAIIVAFVAEFAIRVSTWTFPPFLPPN